MTLHLLPKRVPSSDSSQPQHNPWSPSLPRWGSTPRTIALIPLFLLPLLTSCNLPSQLKSLGDRNLPSRAQAQEAEQSAEVAPPSDPQTKARSAAIAINPTEPAAPTPVEKGETQPSPTAAPVTPPRMSLAASTAKTPDSNVISPPTETDPQAESTQGALRVGNQTEHPLRIAFLSQGHVSPEQANEAAAKNSDATAPAASEPDSDATQSDPASLAEANAALRDPFHWDFAPGEGGRDGLLLALPQGDLNLKTGDVVVAFAQDGSQRYWGPYVVGQTPLPYWNGDRDEWQLLVQP